MEDFERIIWPILRYIRDLAYDPFGLFVVTLLLFIATWRLARTADMTAKRQLRAYVSLRSARIDVWNGGQQLKITVIIKNSGTTPAYGFHTWIDAQISGTEAKPYSDMPPADLDRPRSILGPGDEVTLTKYIEILTPQYYSVQRGELKVYAWGRIDYRDAFGKRRHFIFRSANQGGFVDGLSALGPYITGYEAN